MLRMMRAAERMGKGKNSLRRQLDGRPWMSRIFPFLSFSFFFFLFPLFFLTLLQNHSSRCSEAAGGRWVCLSGTLDSERRL